MVENKSQLPNLVDGDVSSKPGPRIGEADELVVKTAYPEIDE